MWHRISGRWFLESRPELLQEITGLCACHASEMAISMGLIHNQTCTCAQTPWLVASCLLVPEDDSWMPPCRPHSVPINWDIYLNLKAGVTDFLARLMHAQSSTWLAPCPAAADRPWNVSCVGSSALPLAMGDPSQPRAWGMPLFS